MIENIRLAAGLLPDLPSTTHINFANGMLNITTGELEPHDPKFSSTLRIPVSFDKTGKRKAPHWERFIETTFPSQSQDIAWEIPAYLLIPEISIRQAPILIGAGWNGKTIYCDMITRLIGEDNVANVSMQRLADDQFAAAELVGKLVNIYDDLPSRSITDTGVFKAVTGGGRVSVRRLYRPGFQVRLFSRMLFSANQFPRSLDTSDGYFSRIAIIEFTKTFTPATATPRHILLPQLTDPHELSGVINYCIPALRNLLTKNSYTMGPEVLEASLMFRAATNPIAVWLGERTELAADGVIPCGIFLIEYQKFCRERGLPLGTMEAFSREVHQVFPTVKTLRPGSGAERTRVFAGLRWRV